MSNTINNQTKLGIGIVAIILGFGWTCITTLSEMNASVNSVDMRMSVMDSSLQEVKRALDRNTQHITNDSKELAVMKAELLSVKRRVRELEAKK